MDVGPSTIGIRSGCSFRIGGPLARDGDGEGGVGFRLGGTDMDNVQPVPAVGTDDWFRWVWLVSRGGSASADTLDTIATTVFSDSCTSSVRLAALNALWSVAPVAAVIEVERRLLDGDAVDMGLAGLAHPRWWKDPSWLAACRGWLGRNAVVDETLARVLSWTERPVPWVRVPAEVWERTGISGHSQIAWIDVLETGMARVEEPPQSPFETFWRRHMQDWAHRWLQWEENLFLYRWRLGEEADLVAWTGSPPYPASVPEAPAVEWILGAPERPGAETLFLTMLGLGYTLGYHHSAAAAAQWDAVWSSWASSLHYMTFEILANVQTTEWHIGGLTGALRDHYALQRWGLSLD